jgi:sRNA-binding protein
VTSNCVLNVSKARSILLSLIVPKSPILIASVNAVTNAVVGFSSNSNTSSSEPSVTSTLSRPPLEYIGLITNKQNGQQLAVIKHNNQIYKVRLGDKIANCTIFNIQKDSVQVSLKGAINTVKR